MESSGDNQVCDMTPVSDEGDFYRTAARDISPLSRLFPSGAFYRQLIQIVCKAGWQAKRGHYGDADWSGSSVDVLRALESVGLQVEISGLDYLRERDSPCVLVGNHMSMLETFVLPGVVRPFMPVTFVVKESLLDYPVFCHVMRSRDPVAVGRTSPREDFAVVMKGGKERLDRGISIIVFPQTTRTPTFDPKEFNSIGIKLARRAGVPVVPVALSTDAWGNGSILKDFGKIDVGRKVHLAFGAPIDVQEQGSRANPTVIEFIQEHLDTWNA